jgi:hypothetical protein
MSGALGPDQRQATARSQNMISEVTHPALAN